MNLNKFTEKAQEAVIQAQGLAEEYSHSEMHPRHLLLALLQQEGGVVPQIAQHLSVNPDTLAQAVDSELQNEVKVYGGSRPSLSRTLSNVLRDADYSGYVVLEYEAREDPFKAIPRYLAQLRKLIDDQ